MTSHDPEGTSSLAPWNRLVGSRNLKAISEGAKSQATKLKIRQSWPTNCHRKRPSLLIKPPRSGQSTQAESLSHRGKEASITRNSLPTSNSLILRQWAATDTSTNIKLETTYYSFLSLFFSLSAFPYSMPSMKRRDTMLKNECVHHRELPTRSPRDAARLRKTRNGLPYSILVTLPVRLLLFGVSHSLLPLSFSSPPSQSSSESPGGFSGLEEYGISAHL